MIKDQKKLMENDETFGLLRDRLFFKVMYDVPNGTTKSEEKEMSDVEEPSEHNGEEKSKKPKEALDVKEEGKDILSSPAKKKRVLPNWMVEMAGSSATKASKAPKASSKTPSKPAAPPKKKKVESDNDWDEEESEEEVKPKSKSRGRPTKIEKPKREAKKSKYAESSGEEEQSEESEEEEEEEVKPKKGRGRRNDQGSNKRGRPSRSAACKRGSYVDDFVAPDDMSEPEEEEEDDSDKNQDSDFQISGLEESGSDWEMSQRSKKQKPTRQGTRKSARQGRKKRYTSDFSDEDDEEYVPRPTKRRASMSANKKFKSYKRDDDSEEDSEDEKPSKKSPKKGRGRGTPAKGRRRRNVSESEEEESEEEEEESEEEVKKKSKKKKQSSEEEEEESEEEKPKKKKARAESESEEETSSKEKKDAKPAGKKRRRPCQFGKKCYRKNPVHFKDYCHPGDESYEASDEDKGSNQYGSDSYRISPGHGSLFSHAMKLSSQSAKKASKVSTGDDDDGLPNTYDYNDSFIDDDVDSNSSIADPEGEDSDYVPEDSQDLRDLRKEAGKFMKNKKMQQKL